MSKGLKRSLRRTREPRVFEITASLTAANIIAMNGAPVEVIPAQGANKFVIVESVLFKMTRTSTAFTGGGAVSLKYSGGATITNTIAATVVTTGGAGIEYAHIGPVLTSLTPAGNTAIQITNATGAFATGTGTAEVYIKYRVVTA